MTTDTEPTTIAEAVNGFDQMDVTDRGGNIYTVTSWRNDSLTAHEVNLYERTCTCEDQAFNMDGNEVCDHIIKVGHVAPTVRSVEQDAMQFLLEALETLRQARENGPVTYPASEVMETDGADSGQAAASQEDASGPDQAAVEGAVGAVEAWLVDLDVNHEPIQVWPGRHGETDGVRIDWAKKDLGEKDHEFLKAKIKDLDGYSYHAGWTDDGCRTCGHADGEGFYHVSVAGTRGL